MIADRRAMERATKGIKSLADGAVYSIDADYAEDEADWAPPPAPAWLTGEAA